LTIKNVESKSLAPAGLFISPAFQAGVNLYVPEESRQLKNADPKIA